MAVQNARVRARQVAERQFGRIARHQLLWIGIGRGQIESWTMDGYLARVLPGVYAVGHRAPSAEADLFAAVLYAGPGAMLSHSIGAWWRELIERRPGPISVSTPRRCRSLPGITVHARRTVERTWYKGLPVTSIEQTALDLAAESELWLVRLALAQLDYRRLLDVKALRRICGRGRPGSAVLRRALRRHEPSLARTRSRLEIDFVLFCERYGVPLPQFNVDVHGILVDCYWPAQQLVVELDGGGNHATFAQIKRDRRNELLLRGHGLEVLRYSWDLVHAEPEGVRDDVLRTLAARS